MVHGSEETVSGIHLDSNGDRVVGGSLRPDGSVRKTVKVRPGFTPVEDIKRINVKGIRKERLKKADDAEAKVDDCKKPKSRFSALNCILQQNQNQNREIGRKTGSNYSTSSSNTNVIKDTTDDPGAADTEKLQEESVKELETSFSSLSFEGKTTPTKEIGQHQPPSSSRAPENPKEKKYRPPKNRKKKYTLADLDNS